MATYHSKSVEIEAMQWSPAVAQGNGRLSAEGTRMAAEQIVAWVEAHGGEARYPVEVKSPDDARNEVVADRIRIMLHTSTGWAPLRPGDWAINSGTRFTDPSGQEYTDHYPCDPETFEKRWEANA